MSKLELNPLKFLFKMISNCAYKVNYIDIILWIDGIVFYGYFAHRINLRCINVQVAWLNRRSEKYMMGHECYRCERSAPLVYNRMHLQQSDASNSEIVLMLSIWWSKYAYSECNEVT